MRIDVITIFPEYFAALQISLIGKAIEDGLIDLRVHDLRDWTSDRHRTVDDAPYGGGAGMVMLAEPWGLSLDDVLTGSGDAHVVVPTPSGEPFTQARAAELVAHERLVFLCGRYEGIDQRVVDDLRERGVRVSEISLGDFVVNGGEVAVLAIVEAVARLLPGVLGNAESVLHESHADGLLEGPAYTKPLTWRGHAVPEVLLSGHHGEIARWRREQALRRTVERRPDLLAALDPGTLSSADLAVLAALGWVLGGASDGSHRLVRPATPVAD